MSKLLLALLLAVAPDLSGRWILSLNPDFSGHDQSLSCTLKQENVTLSADCLDARFTGRVDGAKVSLQLKTGRNNELSATFEGQANNDGSKIEGMWRLPTPDGERTGKFTFSKQ